MWKLIPHHYEGEIQISLVTNHFWIGFLGIAEALGVRIKFCLHSGRAFIILVIGFSHFLFWKSDFTLNSNFCFCVPSLSYFGDFVCVLVRECMIMLTLYNYSNLRLIYIISHVKRHPSIKYNLSVWWRYRPEFLISLHCPLTSDFDERKLFIVSYLLDRDQFEAVISHLRASW